jgi:hypothetical protein
MHRHIARTVLTLVPLVMLFAEPGAFGGINREGPSVTPDQGPPPPVRPFKLKGGGQIDVGTFGLEFAGTATHLGQFAASGQIDPTTLQIQGTMTAADGDALDWVAIFQQGPLGEIEATLTITGGTGRFTGASGGATGPVGLDPDFMFTLNLQGTIEY